MIVKIAHLILSYCVRPVLHKFGYDVECTAGWIEPSRRGWRLLEPYRRMIVDYVPHFSAMAPAPKIIWQFWWQGVDSAPLVVRRCMDSVRYFMGGDYQIVVLDRDNIDKYVSVDEIIRIQHDAGNMSHTHFSDYLRAKLLSERGGVWIDATVFLSARIPDDILLARYFIFKSGPFAIASEIPDLDNLNAITEFSHGEGRLLPSSWFLVAKPKSPINQLFVAFENMYWRRERKLYNYYLYHMLTTYAVCANRYCREEFVSAPLYLNFKPHLLMFRREEPAEESLIRELFKASPIHKLTYKYNNFPQIDKSLLGMVLSGELLEVAKNAQR